MPFFRQYQLPPGFAEAARPVSVRTDSSIGVLVVHGITSTPGSMAHLIQRFADAGFNVEAPLLPGHGTHWSRMRGVTWQNWVDSLRAPLADLQSRCSHVFICALSLGGGLAILLARDIPSISGLILVNHLAAVKKSPLVILAPIVQRFVPTLANISNDIKEPGVVEPAYPRLCTYAGYQAILVAKEVQRMLHEINTPTLIFKSIDDHVLPRVSAEKTMEKLGSTDKEMVWLKNSYHVATMDYDKTIIADKSLEFIEKRRSR